MTASQIIKEKHNARLYYSGLMRTTCIAHTLNENGGFPWESRKWKDSYPVLSDFLNNTDSAYGSTQEDYDLLLHQFSIVFKEYKWLKDDLHVYMKSETNKYLPKKYISIKAISIYAALIAFSVFIGSSLF